VFECNQVHLFYACIHVGRFSFFFFFFFFFGTNFKKNMYVCLKGNMKLVAKGMDATLDLGGDNTIKWVNTIYLQGCRQGFGHCLFRLVYHYCTVYHRKT
jgi:hypothetical protein